MIFSLREKITSSACLEISGLNDTFHRYLHWEVFDKFSLSLFEKFKWSLTNEKIDVSSAKCFGLKKDPLRKSFTYTKKNNAPKIDPWGTPALMEDDLGDWPLRTTLWCLFLRNEFISP